MIPFKPEKVEDLKERYPESIKELYIQLDVARGLRVRPGTQKENVFDFLDGVRLIISKEQEPSLRLVIHISGSVRDNEDNAIKLEDHHIHHIVEHFNLISSNIGALELLGISNEKIVHLIYRLDN